MKVRIKVVMVVREKCGKVLYIFVFRQGFEDGEVVNIFYVGDKVVQDDG